MTSLTATTVGIDQTAPGTTNKVVAELSGSIPEGTAEIGKVQLSGSKLNKHRLKILKLQLQKPTQKPQEHHKWKSIAKQVISVYALTVNLAHQHR